MATRCLNRGVRWEENREAGFSVLDRGWDGRNGDKVFEGLDKRVCMQPNGIGS